MKLPSETKLTVCVPLLAPAVARPLSVALIAVLFDAAVASEAIVPPLLLAPPVTTPKLAFRPSPGPVVRLLTVSCWVWLVTVPSRNLPKFTVVGLRPAVARLPTVPLMTPSRLITCVPRSVSPRPLPMASPLDFNRICTLAVFVPVDLVSSVTTMLVLSVLPASSPVMPPAPEKLAALMPPMLPKAAFNASEKPSVAARLLTVSVRVCVEPNSTLPKLMLSIVFGCARR